MKFDLKGAQAFAADGKSETWIHMYLNSGTWANPGLSEGLKLQHRWWIGPVEMPLSSLSRCCGPERHMEYRIHENHWERGVQQILKTLADVRKLPPLIVQYHGGDYIIRDGNHRSEAMQRKEWPTCWAFIWYDDVDAWRQSPYHPVNEPKDS